MINHFRTRLMNIAYDGELTDYISADFSSPATLSAQLSEFRDLLFPTSDRAEIVTLVNAYTNLLIGYGVPEIITMYDPRLTYKMEDLYDFQIDTVDLVSIADSVLDSSITKSMLDTGDNYDKYVDMYASSPFKLQRFAAVIAAYSYKLT